MALKVHRVVVVSCPRCVLTGDPEKLGVGKSCFCNRFVRPDSLKLHCHTSRISEQLWRDNTTYNGDHFLYWGAATKRHADGSKTRFQVVEQTEFFDIDADREIVSHRIDGGDYVQRASATHFISRGKIAYKVHEEEAYAIPSSLKSNPMRARAVQLFPNNEFSEGKGVSGFICLFDPTLEGENIKIQFDFLTKLINKLLKTKRKIVVACTKCDEVNEARIQFGANLIAAIPSKKPIPFIQTSAKEGINIEEPFHYIVGQYHKKTKGGRNSPVVRLGLTYSETMESRGKDVAFAVTTFKRLIREKVHLFTAEWDSTWPYLQLDSNCSKAVEVIGLSEARKIFCQRLMELKVAEVKESSKQKKQREKKKEEQSRSDQNEILEAFSTHPDLINESAYDFVYTPSLPSTETPIPPSPSSSSPIHTSSFSPTHATISHSNSMTSPIHQQSSTFGSSPPPILPSPPLSHSLPPICVDPGEVISYRTPVFSPTSTCLSVNSFTSQQLNRSQELLATLPRVNVGIQRHSSLRYKNRTLPPLPTSGPQNLMLKFAFSNSLTKSQPHLDENGETDNDEEELPRPVRRKLSSSIDCLHSNSTINDYTDGDQLTELEASPYISPIDVHAALFKSRPRSSTIGTSSVRVPPSHPYPSLPEGFLTLGRRGPHSRQRPDKRYTGSNPRLSEPPVPITKPRSSSSPPPPPTSLTFNSVSSYSTNKSVLSPNGVTSLDIGDGWQRGSNILGGEDSTGDDVSIISGPFAEVDEFDPLPPLMSEIQKSNESLSRITSSRIPSSVSSSTVSYHEEEMERKTESIYASIPATGEEDYLTMKSGISMDDLLNTTPNKSGVSTASLPQAKSVIKKLQIFANRGESETNLFSVRGSVSPSNTPPRESPARKKKASTASMKSLQTASVMHFQSPRLSLDSETATSPLLNRNWTRASIFNRRPLPQSPTKIRRVITVNRNDGGHSSPTKRKNSFGGDSNIYETIDGEHMVPWMKQLRMEKAAKTDETTDSSNNSQYCQIIDHFLSTPQVQELWRNSVKTVYPDFVFPDSESSSVQPLYINPDYFDTVQRTEKVTKIESVSVENESPSSTEKTKHLELEETKVSNNEENPPNENKNMLHVPQLHKASLSKKESLTDKVLAQLNQHLLLHQDSSSSEESDSDDDDDDDDDHYSDTDENSDIEDRVLNTRSKISLSSICERFSHTDDDDLIMLDRTKYITNDQSILDCIPHLNGYKDTWLKGSQDGVNVKISINHDEEEDESGTGSSSPTVSDTPPVSSVVHPVPIKNNNHLAICHFNSLDSGISANGNISVDDQS